MKPEDKRMFIAYLTWSTGVALLTMYIAQIDLFLGLGFAFLLLVIGLRICWG